MQVRQDWALRLVQQISQGQKHWVSADCLKWTPCYLMEHFRLEFPGCVTSWDCRDGRTEGAFVPELHSLMQFARFQHLDSACSLELMNQFWVSQGRGSVLRDTTDTSLPNIHASTSCNQSQMIPPVLVYLIRLNEQCESPSDRLKLSNGQSEKVNSRVPCQCLHADNYTHKPPFKL